MAYQPKDPNKFFSKLGRNGVVNAIVNGELDDDTKAKAEIWLSFRKPSERAMVILTAILALFAFGGLVLSALHYG